MSTFASVQDITDRLGPTFSPDAAQVAMLLGLATDLITDSVQKDAAWAAALAPVPPVLRTTCIEAVVRVLKNPGGVRLQHESLGAYTHSERFSDESSDLELTPAEERRLARAVFGSNAAGATAETVADDISTLYYVPLGPGNFPVDTGPPESDG